MTRQERLEALAKASGDAIGFGDEVRSYPLPTKWTDDLVGCAVEAFHAGNNALDHLAALEQQAVQDYLADVPRWRMSVSGLEPDPQGEWVRWSDIIDGSAVTPCDVVTLSGGRRVVVVKVSNTAMRDHRGRIAVRNANTGRLSYISERRLTQARRATR